MNTPAEVLEAEHLHQRGFWVHTDDPGAGPSTFRDHRAASPKGAGRSAGSPRASVSTTTSWIASSRCRPVCRRSASAAVRATAASTRPPLVRDPHRRPDDGVVRSLRHDAARRPRGRGHPGREPVGPAADDEGVPAPPDHRQPGLPRVALRPRCPRPSRPALEPPRHEQRAGAQQALVHHRHPPARGARAPAAAGGAARTSSSTTSRPAGWPASASTPASCKPAIPASSSCGCPPPGSRATGRATRASGPSSTGSPACCGCAATGTRTS